MEIKYRCKSCHHRFGVAIAETPEGIPLKDCPRWRCPSCGAATAPEAWLDGAYDEKEHFRWEGFFRRWSNCPNAWVCSLHDQYAPDCEAGVVMQRCFVALHHEIELIPARLAADKPKRAPRQKRQELDQPGSPYP